MKIAHLAIESFGAIFYYIIAELQVGDTDKPLKLMSSWKQLLTKYSSDKGHGSHGNSSLENVPTFQLRRNIFFPIAKEKLVKLVNSLSRYCYDVV